MNDLNIKAAARFSSMMNMSDEDMKQTLKGLRAERVKNKIIENKNKPPLESPDVLDADDFTFEPFEQKRGEDGDSGELLLAVNKKDKSDKYIVKHAFTDCAANEYVYSKMAQAMDVKMPEVKLFRLSDPLDDTIFKTEYAAGIKYLNIINEHVDIVTSIGTKNNDDFYYYHTLHKLFLENDLPHIVLADDGYIYRIDCSDAFAIDDMTLMFAGTDDGDDNNVEGKALSAVNKHGFSQYWDIYDIDRTIGHYVREFGHNEAIMLVEPLRAVRQVRKPKIAKFLNTLCYFYPDCVGEYYSVFLAGLKKAMRKIEPPLTEKYSDNWIMR